MILVNSKRCLPWLVLSCICAAGPFLTAQVPALQVSESLTSSDWPWWRGPHRDGTAPASAKIPARFGTAENVLWKTALPGRGHSSPIVVGNQVFLTAADEAAQTQIVMAYDLTDGSALWQRELNRGGFPQNNHKKNTEATPTVASDGQRLFITFFHHKRIELSALDLQGQPLWQRDVGAFDPKMFEYGYAPSPLLYGDYVIVAAEYDGESAVSAYERSSGNQAWRAPRPSSISFSSPVVAHVAGRDQLLISGQGKVCSYDPHNGQALWEVIGTTAATCGTVVWSSENVFASGGFPKAETIAVRGDGSQVVWRNTQKLYEQSMILIDGYLYGLTDKGVLYCWRANDGQEMWRERLSGPVSASPVFAGGHVIWANEAGTFYVFRPNSERFELVAENRLGDEAFASPAVAGNRLLVRVADSRNGQRTETLYCIGQ